jgi:hypothetical protein
MAVGAAVAVALLWGSIPSASSPNCGSPAEPTPFGSAFAFGPPAEQYRGDDHWYNFSDQSASGIADWAELAFEVQTGLGANITPGPEWTAHATNATGAWIGVYSLTGPTAGTWTMGGGQPVTNQERFDVMTTPENLSAQGNLLVVRAAGGMIDGCPAIGWTITVSIP